MDPSIRVLWQAACENRRLSVITPEGRLPGYLVGIDTTHMVLYAWFRRDDDHGVWAVVVVPRTMAVLIDDVRLEVEPDQVQKNYLDLAHPVLDAIRMKISGKDL